MADLRLERTFTATPERLFRMITTRDGLLLWWGPEGMDIPEFEGDFTREGPWMSVMRNAEGQRFKVSGQVTHVSPGRSVGFTWAWHDETGARGDESHVTLSVEPHGAGGSRLVLDHRELVDAESAASHEGGWTSSLNKLEKALA